MGALIATSRYPSLPDGERASATGASGHETYPHKKYFRVVFKSAGDAPRPAIGATANPIGGFYNHRRRRHFRHARSRRISSGIGIFDRLSNRWASVQNSELIGIAFGAFADPSMPWRHGIRG
jgi:hypothetical protein